MWPFYLPRVIEMEDSDEQTSNETGHLVSSLLILYSNNLILHAHLRFTCYFKDEYRPLQF